MLFMIASLQRKSGQATLRGSWISAAFLYAISFSFAYLSLTAGTGALILFGSMQITMIIVALKSGERPQLLEWIGLILALSGLVYLVFPGLSAPAPLGSTLMALAGSAWGLYTIRGRGSQNPLASTAGNFIYAVPMIVLIRLFTLGNVHMSTNGILLATLSGAIASGVGYVIWYAAIVQLSVPVLTVWGGIAFLAEHVMLRLLLAGVLILGGIGLSVLSRGKS